MATILRTWCYQYQWLFDLIVGVSSLPVGGEARFRQLPMQGLSLSPEDHILDLCCGSGQATQWLVAKSQQVVGLDCDPVAIFRAQKRVPQATYVEAWAEKMPFADNSFDCVHTSATLHEMTPEQLHQILSEVHRVLKPGGCFALVDFHQPKNLLLRWNLYLFLWLFENQSAWNLIRLNLSKLLTQFGFNIKVSRYPAGGSLQVIQAYKI
ncbi:MAG: class I SAM-dependent methyltransferase [Cyanobacteria bacterium J06621_11]